MKRIQRTRTKNWRMPENAVSVTRPGKWGNPMRVIDGMIHIRTEPESKLWEVLCKGDLELMLRIYRYMLFLPVEIDAELKEHTAVYAWRQHYKQVDFSELFDKDLACFCPLGNPCHGNILIEKVEKLN